MYSAGQLIISGIQGTTLTDEEKSFIENEKIGGVILFSRNYESPTQLAQLVNSIQALRDEYPLFIAVDHEGGRVIRFKNHFTQFPSMRRVAEKGSPKLCYEVHKLMAEELSACGVNLSFSPVCDLLTNPTNSVIGDRAFGSDPEEVSKYVSAAVRGLEANHVLACAKHFPGHGDTLAGNAGDSHSELPVVETGLDQLLERELIPFNKAVKARVEMVMMAHLVVKAIDSRLPCTLSDKAHLFLREKLKFNKIIISDDMEMQAITKYYPEEEVAVMAILAGSDMLIYRSCKEAKKATTYLQDALKTKKIKNNEFEKKLNRIMECKKAYLSDYRPLYIPSVVEKINTKSALELLRQL